MYVCIHVCMYTCMYVGLFFQANCLPPEPGSLVAVQSRKFDRSTSIFVYVFVPPNGCPLVAGSSVNFSSNLTTGGRFNWEV
jgi:hypothetical protein